MSTKARGAARLLERPSLRVVQGRRRPTRVAMIPAAVVLVLAVFAVAGLQAYLDQEGFRAAKLERALNTQEERFRLLRSQAAQLSSPARLELQARALGLTAPSAPRFLPAPAGITDGPTDDTAPPYGTKRLLAEVP